MQKLRFLIGKDDLTLLITAIKFDHRFVSKKLTLSRIKLLDELACTVEFNISSGYEHIIFHTIHPFELDRRQTFDEQRVRGQDV